MRKICALIIKDEGGATVIEYALIGAFISIVIVAAITFIGTNITNTFNQVSNGFNR